MSLNKRLREKNREDLEIGADDQSFSILFPYPFLFRSREQLNEYISQDFLRNRVAYYSRLVLGVLSLILPMFNVFSVYRALIYQREDFSDVYSVFHSIIFYGEFILVHGLVLITMIRFILVTRKNIDGCCSGKGQWVNFLDMEFTLMAFNLLKLVPVFAVNGFNFLWTQILVAAPVFLQYSRLSQIIAFSVFFSLIFVQTILLVILLLLFNLVKVYQISFVGEVRNPLDWNINQWLLFAGFAANIINITDIPTVSQLAFMWDLTNKYWSHDTNIWLKDKFAPKRKICLYDQISERIGVIKAFLWVRTLSAIDLHALVRLPPPQEQPSEKF